MIIKHVHVIVGGDSSDPHGFVSEGNNALHLWPITHKCRNWKTYKWKMYLIYNCY